MALPSDDPVVVAVVGFPAVGFTAEGLSLVGFPAEGLSPDGLARTSSAEFSYWNFPVGAAKDVAAKSSDRKAAALENLRIDISNLYSILRNIG